MCGLAGIWRPKGWDHESQASLEAMTNSLIHRGPDDKGMLIVPEIGLGLGFRRLSIIDLSQAGHQPMMSATGRFAIVFNGEIYNFRELRSELAGRGADFKGHSDTEVILAACEQWGVTSAIRRLVGMFAIAIWDRQDELLHLVRDRFGEKPLYFAANDKTLLFGSELKALRAHREFNSPVDRSALGLYLRHGYVPGPFSIYQGVRKVLPGQMISFQSAKAVRQQAYWTSAAAVSEGEQKPFQGTEEAAVNECESLLLRAVGQAMVSDVPLGAFLSGGIDSSLIVALMQAQSGRAVRTFTIGFGQANYNEAPYAKAVARHLGTDHTELYVTADQAISLIPRLQEIYDEPFADSSQLPTFLVAQMARQNVTVSLSGDGGDELFGGYNRYFLGERLNRWRRRLPQRIRTIAARGIREVSPTQWDRAFAAAGAMIPRRYRVSAAGDRLHKLAGVLAADSREAVYLDLLSLWPPETALGAVPIPGYVLNSPEEWSVGNSFTHRMMYFDSVSYLPDDILVKVDRATMSVSLESRAPFLDHRVAEFAWSLPLPMKVRDGQGKVILRRILEKYVPDSLTERPKMGFGVPLDLWLRGPLREWGSELLEPERLRREGFLDARAVSQRWEDHLSGRRNWQYHLWAVLMFQAWREAVNAF